jgi:FkbH-like protein
VALLSSFPIELVKDHLIARGCTEGLLVETYCPGYDQYHQEILNPHSELFTFQPDVIILAVDGRRWVPVLYERFLQNSKEHSVVIETISSNIRALLTQLRARSNATVLLHSLPYPQYSELGMLDMTYVHGQREIFNRVNQALSHIARELGAVYLVDMDAIIGSVGHTKWYDRRLEFFARSPIARSAMDSVACVYLRYLRGLYGYSRKCVIVDLDDTLWGGIVGERGPRGIILGTEYPGNAFVAFQRALLCLRDRGVLLAIASKNNRHDVERAFAENPEMVLSLSDFSAKEIHWQSKSSSILRIAKTLNLDLRHMLFVDDSPTECLEVQMAIPRLTVIRLPFQPERYIDALLAEGLFDTLTFSTEDGRRAQLYEQRGAAERVRCEASSIENYYSSLEMRAYLEPVMPHNVARASQMTQKTTQFNTSTIRYTPAEINAYLNNSDYLTLTVRLIDRFGDNGIIGLLLARRRDALIEIDTLLISCRVISRTIETLMLHWLVNKAKIHGALAIVGSIVPTDRNMPVRDLYDRHGFSSVESNDRETRWQLDIESAVIDAPRWFQITDIT